MSYSIITYIGDGSPHQYMLNFSLGYIQKSDVKCQVNNEVDGFDQPVYRNVTFLTADTVTIDGAVPGTGEHVVFTRTVSKTQMQNDFEDGAILQETNLDNSFFQPMMAIQEILDGRGVVLNVDEQTLTDLIAQLSAALTSANQTLTDIAAAEAAAITAIGVEETEALSEIETAEATAITNIQAAALASVTVSTLVKEMYVSDTKAQGALGQILTPVQTWITRNLNTVDSNAIDGASLASNQITLPAGTYAVYITSPQYGGSHGKAKLYNVTDAADTLIGSTFTSTSSTFNASERSIIQGVFTIADTKVFEVRHIMKVSSAFPVSGGGIGGNFAGYPEIYTQVRISQVNISTGTPGVPTNSWNESSMVYSGFSFDTTGQVSFANNYLTLSYDGTKLYVVEPDSGPVKPKVYQYVLATPFNVSTAVYSGKNAEYAGHGSVNFFRFSRDGTKLYALTDGTHIGEFHLSVAWDITTVANTAAVILALNSGGDTGGFAFSADGKHMYLGVGAGGWGLSQYDFGTAWDLSTASFVANEDTIFEGYEIDGAQISPDGFTILISEHVTHSVYKIPLSVAFNVTTAGSGALLGDLDPPLVTSSSYDMVVSDDGTKLYIIDVTTHIVYEYLLT